MDTVTNNVIETHMPESHPDFDPPRQHSIDVSETEPTEPRETLVQLIAAAILREPAQRLTLSRIYDWISRNYPYYRKENRQAKW